MINYYKNGAGKMSDKKICMLACHEVGYGILKGLIENGIRIHYLVTLSPEQAIKYKVSGYFDFSQVADMYNIPIYIPETYSLSGKKDKDFFANNRFDLMILGGWQRLIPEDILNTLGIGAIGGHGSSNFLPKGRGRSPLNWCLIEGRKRFIMHLILLTPGIDDGDIINYEQFDINEFDTIKTLYYKLSIVTKRMLLRSVPKLLKGEAKLIKQVGEPTYYPKRTPDDGLIKWQEWDVDKIYNFIRALTKPYPGAFTFLENGEKVYIWEAKIFDRIIKYPESRYGQVVEVFYNGDFVVNCLDGLLLVTQYDSNEKITNGVCFYDEPPNIVSEYEKMRGEKNLNKSNEAK
jgi:methionyl-tRNA formyltransferase